MENQEKKDKINEKAKEIISQLEGYTYDEIFRLTMQIDKQARNSCGLIQHINTSV